MQQLISIETVPISIEYVEKAPRKVSSPQSARLQISQEAHKLSIKSSPIPIKMDQFQTKSSQGNRNLTYTATAQYSQAGNLTLNIQMNDSEGDVIPHRSIGEKQTNDFAYKQMERSMDQILDFLPENQGHLPELQRMQINFDMSHLSSGFPPIDQLDTSFLPPELELKVVEMPKVIIKYLGSPIYIPRSADPNYDPPKNGNQIFDGKPNFDVKV